MKPHIHYIVTKGSADGTLQTGDHISLGEDGTVSCIEAMGWIEKEHVQEAMAGVEYEPDRAWAQRKIAEAERIKAEYA